MKRNWLILIALLTLQGALVARIPARPVGGDEHHYIVKAQYLREHGALPRITAEQRAIEAGAFGNSDWRPPGYSLLLAATGGDDFTAEALRPRMAMVHFALMAAAVMIAFAMTGASLPGALVLGIAPWPFAFVTVIGPDSPVAAVSFLGLALLIRRRWFAGSLVLAAALLLRAEMIAIAPVPILVALVVARARRRAWIAAGLALAVVVAAQFAYRSYFVGGVTASLFGGQHIHNAGTFAWVHSWLGTEKEGYDFVYGISKRTTHPLPDRAFANERERAEVEQLIARVRAGGWSEEIDDAFARLAARRRREHPCTALILPRLWNVVHLWLNTETNDQLLAAISALPRFVRRALLAMLLLLKLGLVLAFAVRLAAFVRERSPALVPASFVVARTLLIGVAVNWRVYRFMVSAWLPLIVAVLYYWHSRGRNPASPGVSAER